MAGERQIADNQSQPRDLLHRIVSRLGLERQLKGARGRMVLCGILSIVCAFLLLMAIGVLRHILVQSSFGPMIRVVVSDPDIALRYRHNLAISIAEATPVVGLFFLFSSLGFVLLSIKVLVAVIEKFFAIMRLIRNHRYGNNQK